MANDTTAIFGTYTAHPDPRFVSTPLDGLSRLSVETRHAAGCDKPACQNYDSNAVKNAVDGAQLVVVCLGLGTDWLSLIDSHTLTVVCVLSLSCTVAATSLNANGIPKYTHIPQVQTQSSEIQSQPRESEIVIRN